METNLNAESVISRGCRRGAGVISLLGLGVAILGGFIGYGSLVSYGLLVFFVLPLATMIAHLAFTQSMTREEKAMWRRELPWSHRSFIAVWTFMISRDVKARAYGFGPYRSEIPR